MGKYRKSGVENFIEIIAKLPWWICIALAFLSYFLLHSIAISWVSNPVTTGDLGDSAIKGAMGVLVSVGQYLLPVLCSFAALNSFIQRFKLKKRYAYTASQKSSSALFDMDWQQFEGLVSEFFKMQGYYVRQLGGDGPDGGIDIVASKGSDKYLVQCKQWKANRVGVQIVRELYGVMSSQGAAGGFVVTAGSFTDEAKKFAKGLNIKLIDGRYLHRAIKQSEKTQGIGNIEYHPRAAQARSMSDRQELIQEKCPMCGKPLVIREAKKGYYKGQNFWGCSRFPACRYTSKIK